MRLFGLAVVLTVSLILAPLAAEAQSAGKVYRVGLRCPAIDAAYPFPVIRATFRVPAPRPHPLALSGVETPVNLALVEATYALEFADGVLEAGPHRR
jgi:hypothetical protein